MSISNKRPVEDPSKESSVLSPFFSSPRRTQTRLSTGLAVAGAIAIALSVGGSRPGAQGGPPNFHSGRNVDIVGPHPTGDNPSQVRHPSDPTKTYPLFVGDPDKKQQNEPSCDFSPTNPLIIFCGINNYSAVDRPWIAGKPFVGAAFSTDGGTTWKSHLHPGFMPTDGTSPMPSNALGYESTADPVVRLVPGMGLYSSIAYNADGRGAVFLSRWREVNTEGGFPYAWQNTIEVASGTGAPGDPGRFLDKEALAVSLNPGNQTYDFVVANPDHDPTDTTPGAAPPTRIQKVPAGTVHMAFAVLKGNDQQDGSKIVYLQSDNYGDSFSPQKTLSAGNSINQAADIAVDSATNRVMVVWRRFGDGNEQDAIMYALSTDGGKQFSQAAVLSLICPFTQGTTAGSFRTTTHPYVTFDGTTFHTVWAERQLVNGQCTTAGTSRIVVSSLSGTTWSAPTAVSTPPASASAAMQFYPTIVSSAGRVLVAWYDTRRDLRSTDPSGYVNDYLLPEDNTKIRRRSADIYATEANAGSSLSFGEARRVSRYMVGLSGGQPVEFTSNKLNPRMFQKGTVPFLSDYIAGGTVRYVPNPFDPAKPWLPSTDPAAAAQPVFFLAWTDNRLVRGNVSQGLDPTQSSFFTPPPLQVASEAVGDPSTPRVDENGPVVCSPSRVGSRDQTVFGVGVFPDIMLGSASAAKPTLVGTNGIRRAYTIVVQNRSAVDRLGAAALTLRVTAPAGATVSFDKTTLNDTQDSLFPVAVHARSSTSRTVYVESTQTLPAVKVEALLPGQTNAVAITYINGNPNAPPLEDPLDPNERITDQSIDQVEAHEPQILYRSTTIGAAQIDDAQIDDAQIDDAQIDDAQIDDAQIDDAQIDDAQIDDAQIDDAQIDDAQIDDAQIDDTTVAAANIQDEDAANPLQSTGPSAQITWKIALLGNTATSMSTRLLLNVDDATLEALKGKFAGGKAQLLVTRRYTKMDVRKRKPSDPPGLSACVPVRAKEHHVIANILNPDITNKVNLGDVEANNFLVNPVAGQPSFTVPPGGAVYVTLRLWDITGVNLGQIGTAVQSQPGIHRYEPGDVLVPPAFSGVPANITVPATGSSGAVVDYAAPTAKDTAQNSLNVACLPASGATFPRGTTTVVCSATDADSQTATATFTVTIENNAPVAVPPSVSTNEDTAATLALAATDVESDPLTYSIVSGPSHGTLSVVSGATYTYTPNANHNGPDSFSFKAYDGTSYSAPVTVEITVNPVNDAPVANEQNTRTDEDTTLAIALTARPDIDGDSLSYRVVSGPSHGTLDGTPPSLTYAPGANYNGSDSFTFVVNDGKVDSAPATVGITVNPVNDAPVATGPSGVTTAEDSALAITLTASDTDKDSPLTYLIASPPSNGTLSVVSGATVTYTPNTNYNGQDSFSFKANDGTADSVPVTVAITVSAVNDAPVASAASVGTNEDTTLAIALAATDIESDPLTYGIDTGPTHGTLSGTPPSLTYSPAVNYHGSDSFSFKAYDGTSYSTPVTVAITVSPVNDAPTFTPPANITTTATSASGIVVTFTANGSDAADGEISIPAACTPASGSTFPIGTTTVNCTVTDNGFPLPTLATAGSFTVTVNAPQYGFKNVQNLPPPATKTFKPGSAVPFAWQFTIGGVAVPSADALPSIRIVPPAGGTGTTFTPEDPGGSSFQYNATTNTHQFNWQTKTATGASLPAGNYQIYVKSRKAGQQGEFGPFKVTLK